MELEPGYKKTEVGVIPEGWEVKSLGDMFSVSGGLAASREQLSDSGFCYLHYGDIHKSTKTYIDVETEFSTIPKLDVSIASIPPKSLLDDGDIVFVDASEDDEGASKHVVVRNPSHATYISGLHTIVLKSKDASLDNEYKRFCFQTRDVKRQFLVFAVGTKVTGISKSNILKVRIPVPPRKEQSAIASTLSDADSLIASLEKLIAKKRNIKQGTMQRLLTGNKRLPGFTGEWERKKLWELLKIRYGRSQKGVASEDGKFPILATSGRVGSTDQFIYDRPSVLIGRKGTIDFPQYTETPFWAIDTIFYTEVYPPNIPKFIFYRFQMINWRGYNEASGVPSLNTPTIEAIEIMTPNDLEQSAIAQVLSDMDVEIGVLEAKLVKVRLIKQGMMQELLTGKRRMI